MARFPSEYFHLRTPRRGIVYFHGGGWVMGDLDEFDTLSRKLVDATAPPWFWSPTVWHQSTAIPLPSGMPGQRFNGPARKSNASPAQWCH
jgi:hypothetical protein